MRHRTNIVRACTSTRNDEIRRMSGRVHSGRRYHYAHSRMASRSVDARKVVVGDIAVLQPAPSLTWSGRLRSELPESFGVERTERHRAVESSQSKGRTKLLPEIGSSVGEGKSTRGATRRRLHTRAALEEINGAFASELSPSQKSPVLMSSVCIIV